MDLKDLLAKYNGIESEFFLFLVHICVDVKWLPFRNLASYVNKDQL